MAKAKNPPNVLQAVLDRQIGLKERQNPITAPLPPKQKKNAQKAKKTALPPIAKEIPTVQVQKRPSREGKQLVGGHFKPEFAKQLKVLAAEEGKSVQVLLEEAINLLFVKKGKGKI